MRLGGPIFKSYLDPGEWAEVVKGYGYSAAYSPVDDMNDAQLIQQFEREAKKADIVIAEVGAWSNPIHVDDHERKKALQLCKDKLALADHLGAVCCVNIAGSRGARWDGPDRENFSEDTFNLIVDSVREIIDDVKPKRSFYCLEMMPWIYPYSADTYLDLLKAIDREKFGVHLDPVNIITSPFQYFNNAQLIKECFDKLGPFIKSCHAKDIILQPNLTVHLDEIRPGLGALDYRTFLMELNKLHPDIPFMLEHLESEEEYRLAANFIRGA